VTAAERARFTDDADLLGPRVAYWLAREAQGWSVLDEAMYWVHVGKCAAVARESTWSPYGAA
jgi:hypothetical protein